MLEIKETHVARGLILEALHGNLDDTRDAEYILRIDGDALILTGKGLERLVKRLEEALHGV